MIGCKKCSNCCKYEVMELAMFDRDMDWLKIRQGKVVGNWALVPMPCPVLVNDRCSVHDHKPRFCKDFPRQFEGQAWLTALGCQYFNDDRSPS